MLIYGAEEGMNLPEFSCTGKIIKAERTAAAAALWYDYDEIPIVRIPEQDEFSPDLLPETLESIVNRDNMDEEEDLEVTWDPASFPESHERTLVTGNFGEGYAVYRNYAPCCLVIWESDTQPFFLNCYAERGSSVDIVYMRGEATQKGVVHLYGSSDGVTWTEFTEDNLFIASDIDGGRGGETSPGEGGEMLPDWRKRNLR